MPKPKDTKKARQKFKLVGGPHVGPDYSQEPSVTVDQRTGKETVRYPSKTYHQGDTVESEIDLVSKFGDNKFTRLAARGEPEDAEETFDPGQAQFVGGQVSSGLPQATTGTPGQTLKEPDGPENLPATPPDLRADQRRAGVTPEGEESEEGGGPEEGGGEGPKAARADRAKETQAKEGAAHAPSTQPPKPQTQAATPKGGSHKGR